MKNEELKRIEVTLNIEKKHEYYVYMLLSGDTPFYIGKGKGARVFSHEADAAKAEELINSITEGREDISANYDELSEKIKTIIQNKGKIKKVIVKWGLTEDEAYMCESALINMYDFLNPGSLSNIVNGHATNAEKTAHGCITKAREVDSFLREVALEPKSFYHTFLESGIDLGKDEIIFFKISTALCDKDSRDDEIVYQCTRSSWNISREPRYAVGLDGTVVKGAYVVDRWSIAQGDSERKEFTRKEVSQLEPKERRVLDLLLSMKDCLLTDEYLNGQWKPYYSKNNAKKWLEHDKTQLAKRIFSFLTEENNLSQEELDTLGNLEPYEAKVQEILSITGIVPELSFDGKHKIWKWNDKEYTLGKTLTERDFHERLFIEWFLKEKI